MCLSWLGNVLQSKGSLVGFLVRERAWVADSLVKAHARGHRSMFLISVFLSFPFSLPSLRLYKQTNKQTNKLLKKVYEVLDCPGKVLLQPKDQITAGNAAERVTWREKLQSQIKLLIVFSSCYRKQVSKLFLPENWGDSFHCT